MNTTDRIRELNDRFRQTLAGGRLMMTRGVAGRNDSPAILERVRHFNEFSEDNDPFAEHDFGAFELANEKFFWKIDYYDKDLNRGSENPADPTVTTRVLTIMLASEY